jgi:hypothetical protein
MRSRGRASILFVALTATLVAPSAFAAAHSLPSNVHYELRLDCPQSLTIQPNTQPGGRPNSVGITCPIRALDEDDLMGSPSIAVDANNPNNLVLASLHGTDGDGPTDRSRGRQPFTTFISTDHGAHWTDRPYNSPDRLRGALGEHPQVFIDPLGHVYVGSLYSRRAENSLSGWNFTIVPQKFKDYNDAVLHQMMSGDYNARFLNTFFPDQMVDQFWFVHDPKTNLMTTVWNERHVEAKGATSILPPVGGPAAEGHSVVGLAWSSSKPTDGWTRANRSRLVGPCLTTTNPVLSQGQIYIGCMVNTNETGYAYAKSPRLGQVDIFRFNVGSDLPTFLGTAPLRGGQPLLGVRADGRVVLLSAFVGSDGAFKLAAAFGQADPKKPRMSWTTTHNYGDDILKPTIGRKILSTTMQDVMYREGSGVVQIIIKQQFEPLGITVDNPLSILQSQYNKVIVAIHETYGVLTTINLDVGNRLNRTIFSGMNPLAANPEAVFNDLTDDLVQLPPQDWKYKTEKLDHYQREFFAVGDYGTVIFGELIELTNLKAPGPAPPEPAPPPNPTPAITVSPAGLITGSVATALVGLLALKLALARRSDPATAITKSGK